MPVLKPSIQATRTDGKSEAFQKFAQAQGELRQRVIPPARDCRRRYPDLKANKAFQDLRVQLERL